VTELFYPYIAGRGRAGLAIARALALLPLVRPSVSFAPVTWVPRGARLADVIREPKNSLLFLANPPGLHALMLLEADVLGVHGLVTEKPSCVRSDEVNALEGVSRDVAVLHVYRQTWGVQTLKALLTSGELGEVVGIEGRYWQASTAVRALLVENASVPQAVAWKDDPELSGPGDAILDVGTHWLDAVAFLAGQLPTFLRTRRSYVNAPQPHRDSHCHVELAFASGVHAFGSISKTFHGADNLFELVVIGSKASARWEFLRPDEIILGQGTSTRRVVRSSLHQGSRQAAYHGLGWLEGYVEILGNYVESLSASAEHPNAAMGCYPSLKENLPLMRSLFRALEAESRSGARSEN
jgi:predicted dehydrogenase